MFVLELPLAAASDEITVVATGADGVERTRRAALRAPALGRGDPYAFFLPAGFLPPRWRGLAPETRRARSAGSRSALIALS